MPQQPFGMLLFSLATASLVLANDQYLFRTPAVSSSEIVFSYAGDLWSVARSGGDARRLTSHRGVEISPVFSPDGKTIAFSGQYDGSRAVYVMPASGGIPKCLTWNHTHDDWPVDWTRDGKRILFHTMGNTATDSVKLYTVDLDGGFPEELPLPAGSDASYSPDGSHLAYVPGFQFQPSWKRYRGGQMYKIWIAKLADSSVATIPRQTSNDFNPMWVGNRIYFLSDRSGPVTLFSYDIGTRQVKQLIENHGFDLKSASAGPGAIVYEQPGIIGLYDLATGKARAVPIRLAGDFPEVRPRRVDVSGGLRSPDLSPNGARVVFEGRGEIITIPNDKGDPRNLTNTPGANEREPNWSPKGDRVAYFSDESGECQIHIRNQNGMGEAEKFRLGDKPAYFFGLRWSPDASKLSYIDIHLTIWYLDLAKKKPVKVDSDYSWPMAGGMGVDSLEPVWSPDSKWLAYGKLLPNHLRAIRLYSIEEGKSHQVTDGMSETNRPVFDRNCKYLYFMASTNSGPTREVDLQSFSRSSESNLYLVVLSKDQPSPFLAESDEENPTKTAFSTNIVKVDWEGLTHRTIALPVAARAYSGLLQGPAGILYTIAGNTIYRFDVASRAEKSIESGASDVVVSANGDRLLYKKDNNWWVMHVLEGGGTETHNLKLNGAEILIDPVAEWREMYHEAWLIMNEEFYDPAHHGLDVAATEKRYATLLDNLSSRQDLNTLLEEAFGEFTASHLFVAGGDIPDAGHTSTGLLGADYTIDRGRYRFQRVYDGESWNPGMRSPLARPGIDVKAGEYLLAVNGVPITSKENIYKVFEGLADKRVTLKIGPDASGDKARDVLIRTVGDEHPLRYEAWIEDNRRLVEKLSNGRIAYLHMPDTGVEGEHRFLRMFYAQVDKEAVIIDDRYNHGGHYATDIMDFLRRTPTVVLAAPAGADWPVPPGIYGPKAMLINEYAASGGDAMPAFFHRLGIGKLVGVTTWGGIVGNSWSPDLMDGGGLKVPCCVGLDPQGGSSIENHGTPPDIEVPMDPKLVREGHDPQLEKAVAVVLEELARNPLPKFQRQAYPKYGRQ